MKKSPLYGPGNEERLVALISKESSLKMATFPETVSYFYNFLRFDNEDEPTKDLISRLGLGWNSSYYDGLRAYTGILWDMEQSRAHIFDTSNEPLAFFNYLSKRDREIIVREIKESNRIRESIPFRDIPICGDDYSISIGSMEGDFFLTALAGGSEGVNKLKKTLLRYGKSYLDVSLPPIFNKPELCEQIEITKSIYLNHNTDFLVSLLRLKSGLGIDDPNAQMNLRVDACIYNGKIKGNVLGVEKP